VINGDNPLLQCICCGKRIAVRGDRRGFDVISFCKQMRMMGAGNIVQILHHPNVRLRELNERRVVVESPD